MKYVVKGHDEDVVECRLEACCDGVILYMGEWQILHVGERGVRLARSVGYDIGVALNEANRQTVKVLEETI